MHMHRRTCAYTRLRTQTYASILARTHTYMCTLIHTYTCTDVIHTQAHKTYCVAFCQERFRSPSTSTGQSTSGSQCVSLHSCTPTPPLREEEEEKGQGTAWETAAGTNACNNRIHLRYSRFNYLWCSSAHRMERLTNRQQQVPLHWVRQLLLQQALQRK